jgi:hypothetical protein
MRWLCIFRACRWTFLTNVMQSHLGHSCGLYQCARCKTVSVGWVRSGEKQWPVERAGVDWEKATP